MVAESPWGGARPVGLDVSGGSGTSGTLNVFCPDPVLVPRSGSVGNGCG